MQAEKCKTYHKEKQPLEQKVNKNKKVQFFRDLIFATSKPPELREEVILKPGEGEFALVTSQASNSKKSRRVFN